MERIARFLFELGQLKRVVRSGWWVGGVRCPESVAEHSFRCAWVGYMIALREGADPARVTWMCLLNDLHEARINDQHKIAQAYMDYAEAETRAFMDQTAGLPGGDALRELHLEFQAGETPEARIARDADALECALQAKEYVAEGHAACSAWCESARSRLRTAGGRALFEEICRMDPMDWFKGLPRVP